MPKRGHLFCRGEGPILRFDRTGGELSSWGRADLRDGSGTCADGCGLVHPRRVVR